MTADEIEAQWEERVGDGEYGHSHLTVEFLRLHSMILLEILRTLETIKKGQR